MVTLSSIIPLLDPDFWFIVLHLKDAYFHIDIQMAHRGFLRDLSAALPIQCSPLWTLDGTKSVHQGTVNGSSSFSLAWGNGLPLFRQLVSKGMILPGSRETSTMLLHLIERLDLQANWKKSTVEHSESIEFIIARLDSVKVYLLEDHFLSITGLIQRLRFEPQNIHTTLSSTLGQYCSKHLCDPISEPSPQLSTSLVVDWVHSRQQQS